MIDMTIHLNSYNESSISPASGHTLDLKGVYRVEVEPGKTLADAFDFLGYKCIEAAKAKSFDNEDFLNDVIDEVGFEAVCDYIANDERLVKELLPSLDTDMVLESLAEMEDSEWDSIDISNGSAWVIIEKLQKLIKERE